MVLRPSRLLLGTNYVGKHRRVSRVSGEPESKPETKHDPGPGPGAETKRRRSKNQRNFKTKQTLSAGGSTVCLLVRSSVSVCLCDCPLARMPFRLALISKSSACEGYQWHFRCEPPRFAAPSRQQSQLFIFYLVVVGDVDVDVENFSLKFRCVLK